MYNLFLCFFSLRVCDVTAINVFIIRTSLYFCIGNKLFFTWSLARGTLGSFINWERKRKKDMLTVSPSTDGAWPIEFFLHFLIIFSDFQRYGPLINIQADHLFLTEAFTQDPFSFPRTCIWMTSDSISLVNDVIVAQCSNISHCRQPQ